MKKVLFLVFLFIICFMGMDGVRADVSKTCFYSGDGFKLVSQTGNYDNFTVAVAISYNCSDSGRCESSYAAGYTDKNSVSQTINFSNATSYFGKGATDYKSFYYDSNSKTINCPSNIVVSGDATSDNIYFYYECKNGEAANGECLGVGKKISKENVPSGDTLADKVKAVTDLGHYNTNSGASTPATNPDDDGDKDSKNSKYLPSIKNRYANDDDNPHKLGDTDCTSLLGLESDGNSLGSLLKNVFFIISMIGVVILIFTIAVDFIKAVASSDNDAISKAFKSAKTRIIAAVILLILPALISFIINLVNDNVIVVTDKEGNTVEVKIGDPSECDIVS